MKLKTEKTIYPVCDANTILFEFYIDLMFLVEPKSLLTQNNIDFNYDRLPTIRMVIRWIFENPYQPEPLEASKPTRTLTFYPSHLQEQLCHLLTVSFARFTILQSLKYLLPSN